nr:hypothetical protein [Candidatus Levybacteria bacterium]
MTERKGSTIGNAAWEIARIVAHPEVEGKENFAILKRHLDEGGSGIIYINHLPGKLDTPRVGTAAQDCGIPLDRTGIFVSRRHTDPDLGLTNKIQHYLLIDKWPQSLGITPIRLTQTKDRGRYPDWKEFNDEAVQKAVEFTTTPGNVLVIAPEGMRSKDKLKEAEAGLAVLFREARDIALAMPVAMPHSTSRVIAGTPFSWSDSLEDYKRNPNIKTKDRMMVRLALLLPPENRGFYEQMAAEFVIPPTTTTPDA